MLFRSLSRKHSVLPIMVEVGAIGTIGALKFELEHLINTYNFAAAARGKVAKAESAEAAGLLPTPLPPKK